MSMPSNKLSMAAVALGLFAFGCSPTDLAMVTGDFGSAIDQMKGAGSVAQRADGSREFTFVIAENAFVGVLSDGEHEAAREDALARWIGNESVCPAGYDVTERSITGNWVSYTGICR